MGPEPDPTHNELKHTTTRKTATHERTRTSNGIDLGFVVVVPAPL